MVTALVEHLTVTGNVCALPSHYKGVSLETNPDLQITIVHSEEDCRELEDADIDSLRRRTAVLFKIPVHQVHYIEEP